MKFLAAQLANITPLAALTVALRQIFKNSNYSLTGLLCIIYPQSELNLFAEIKQMFTCVAIFLRVFSFQLTSSISTMKCQRV